MEGRRYDPEQYKRDQKSTWDDLADGWARWESVFERGGRVVTDRLLELGGVQPGHSVLDIATGLGEPGISAARKVGPQGRVVGIDQAGKMLELARQRGAGLPQLSFQEMDAEKLDFAPTSFDVVLSRWGLMFLPDIEDTLGRIRRLLKPGGRLAATVWGKPDKVPMIGLAFSFIARNLQLPPPPEGLPSPFILSDGARVQGMLERAGFKEVSVTPDTVAFHLDSAQDFVQFSKDVLPPRMRGLVAGAEEKVRSTIWEQVAQAAQKHKSADGRILMECEVLHLRAKA